MGTLHCRSGAVPGTVLFGRQRRTSDALRRCVAFSFRPGSVPASVRFAAELPGARAVHESAAAPRALETVPLFAVVDVHAAHVTCGDRPTVRRRAGISATSARARDLCPPWRAPHRIAAEACVTNRLGECLGSAGRSDHAPAVPLQVIGVHASAAAVAIGDERERLLEALSARRIGPQHTLGIVCRESRSL